LVDAVMVRLFDTLAVQGHAVRRVRPGDASDSLRCQPVAQVVEQMHHPGSREQQTDFLQIQAVDVGRRGGFAKRVLESQTRRGRVAGLGHRQQLLSQAAHPNSGRGAEEGAAKGGDLSGMRVAAGELVAWSKSASLTPTVSRRL